MVAMIDAGKVWNILVELCGARDDLREDFRNHFEEDPYLEYRFCGSLGFGGKVRKRVDGCCEHRVFYVTCYSEDRTPERDQIIADTNARLALLN